MKHATLILPILLLAITIATSQTKSKEVGVGIHLTDFPNSFSLAYKVHKNESNWFRLNAVLGTIQFQKILDSDNNNPTPFSTSFGLSLGLEKRKTFSKVEILRGPQFNLGFSLATLLGGNNNNPSPDLGLYGGVSYLFGVQVHLRNNMKIGIETLPGLNIVYSNDGPGILNFDLGFNSNALNLFMVYQFNYGNE